MLCLCCNCGVLNPEGRKRGTDDSCVQSRARVAPARDRSHAGELASSERNGGGMMENVQSARTAFHARLAGAAVSVLRRGWPFTRHAHLAQQPSSGPQWKRGLSEPPLSLHKRLRASGSLGKAWRAWFRTEARRRFPTDAPWSGACFTLAVRGPATKRVLSP
jgi:hypothetical protein